MKISDVTISAVLCAGTCALFAGVLSQSVGQGGTRLALDMQRHRVVAMAILQYTEDNGHRFPQVLYNSTYNATASSPDRAWGQLILPYHGNMDNLREPEDPVTFAQLMQDLPSCTNRPIQCELNLSVKSHRGYNFQYFSPVGVNCTPSVPFNWGPKPIVYGQVGAPAKALLTVDSVWDRVSGMPRKGGTFNVDMPARHTTANVDTVPPVPGCTARWWNGGWNPSQPNGANVYGYAWPWHKNNSVAVAFADGHASVLSVAALSAGATVRDAWTGRVFDREAYLWDLE